MTNYFIHIPRTGGTSLASSLPYGCAVYLGHDLRAAGYTRPGAVCTDRDFAFAVVRDPFDRLLSCYSFLLGGGMSDEDRGDADRLGITAGGFGMFVRKRLAAAAEWQVHFRPQSFHLRGVPDPRVYDYADKHRAFAEICAAVGVDPVPPLQDLNKSSRSGTVEDQYDEETRAIVRGVYREDFELLAGLRDRCARRSAVVGGLTPSHG